MRRREFITLLGGTAAWPLAARAQQGERVRHVGVLMNLAATDAEGQARLAAFLQGLQEYGWTVGRNMRIDIRWTAGNADDIRKYAAELVAHHGAIGTACPRQRGDRLAGRCPLLAQSGHHDRANPCPLLGVKRTCKVSGSMSASDPKRTLRGASTSLI
jgi:hypothetical protein